MGSSFLGSALGVAIAILLSASAVAIRSHRYSVEERARIPYPKPDWRAFGRGGAALVVFLVLLHWFPVSATWFYGRFLDTPLVFNDRRYDAILFVGHVLATVGIAMEFLGLLWATWKRGVDPSLSRNGRVGSDA
jgi:hypothetical protein